MEQEKPVDQEGADEENIVESLQTPSRQRDRVRGKIDGSPPTRLRYTGKNGAIISKTPDVIPLISFREMD
jgi:hypothetical protein